MFVEQTDAGEDAEANPESLVAGVEETRHEKCRADPEERLEGVHGQDVEEQQVGRRRHHCERRQALRESAATELAGEHPRQNHQSGASQHRGQPDDPEIIAERQRESRDDGDQRWLIDVAPRQVPRAIEVVELVAKDPVLRNEQQMENHRGGGYRQDPSGQARAPVRAVRGHRIGGPAAIHSRTLCSM